MLFRTLSVLFLVLFCADNIWPGDDASADGDRGVSAELAETNAKHNLTNKPA
jgi:hypothetical protein